MKVLMVCLGNICRSSLAEGILTKKFKDNKVNCTVDSAGTGGYHIGDMPDIRSILTAKKNGIDITSQRARKVNSSDYEEFDYIFAMDTYNYQDLLKLANENEKPKIKLILNELYPDSNMSVPDPYYGGDEGFNNVYTLLDSACDKIVQNYCSSKCLMNE